MSISGAPNVRGVGGPGRRTVYSMCGMCATRCPIEVTVEDGRVSWLQGNPNDSVMGASLCARGAAGIPFEYDDERPQTPLVRTGPRGAGQWRRASWDEALDFVADRLREVIDEFGGRGIALSDRGGPFTDLTRTFLRAFGSPNYFDHDATCGANAHHAALSLVGAGRSSIGFDYRRARHIVLYGRNIVESLKVKEAKEFMAALANGARCTYIDPRASFTAAKATRYWQVRPNSDYALNLAIIHEVLKQEAYDKDFVARFVSGMDVLREAVCETTPEWQQQHTGIAAAEIRDFVREIAEDAPHVIFHPGWMVARHKQSFYVSRTTLILNALMGSVETEGGIVLAKTPEDIGRKGLRRLADRLPGPGEPRVDGAGTEHPQWDPAKGLLHGLFAALESGQPYGIGAYFAYRHDPLTSMPDPEALKRAFDKLKLLVAIDVRYSETAWLADVILPESTYLERANILAQHNGARPAFGLRDQAVAPRFDSRPAWWIFREILRRLGLGDALDFESIEELWDYQLEGTGVTVAQLRENGVVGLADAPFITPRDQLKFRTPSGRIEIDSAILQAAGLPCFAPFASHEAPSGDRFHLLFGRPPVLTHGQSLNNPLLNEIAPEQTLWIHPARAAPLGIVDGDEVEISGGRYSAFMKAKVTPWIHPDAVFMLHGYGATVPLATRACGLGVADQRLQEGRLHDFDPAGGGNALTETIVQVRRKETKK
ncbi:molybdopterin-containing oxidoreductase family protein [Sulfurisoma sediminicola]|uniref:Monomeric thiosulfate reductase apoprotein n=1 Tax=Sulfurisoma sediminicola TaxID=1381557 RepID=A0A497XME8_9PROT|nr:molybdopterin-dependent oxidoreductase [Sulfurisoma sediminicola]RLJ67688.1 monomeric thiosulfate reductase apoprotein [Sulfurisoma sediminicola]